MRYFPLFADLSGRRVLVVGGGAVAERKIRLLLDAGAQVTVVAPELTDWLTIQATADAASRDPAATTDSSEVSVAGMGTLVHVAARFEPAHFDGALFAIAATDDRAVNARVAATGRERNVLVNVVDDVELSSFIVPAIVDRSPLVIAISTGGVAPVLARLYASGSKHCSIIPSAFAGWACSSAGAAASSVRCRMLRPDVDSTKTSCAGRWPDSCGHVRSRPPNANSSARLADANAPQRGSVVLVGAGPGDAGLLTLNALRALQQADVILHDRLVSAEVLGLARRDADRISVGKQAGGHSIRQGRIHEIMLEQAQAGRRVVRLKGGDPFVFGRGGEEIEFLRAQGIPFEVVPGITAAIACGAYAGIPLTHREHSPVRATRDCALRRVHRRASTGRRSRRSARLSRFTWVWQALARSSSRLHRARARSGNAGGDRREWFARRTTRRAHDACVSLDPPGRRPRIKSPALVIVGEVAALAEQLHWFGKTPETWDGGGAGSATGGLTAAQSTVQPTSANTRARTAREIPVAAEREIRAIRVVTIERIVDAQCCGPAWRDLPAARAGSAVHARRNDARWPHRPSILRPSTIPPRSRASATADNRSLRETIRAAPYPRRCPS